MGRKLLEWSKKHFDDLGIKIADAEFALKELQQQPMSRADCTTRIELEKTLDDLHNKHEAYWFVRSRVLEVKDGDRNTSYFHHKASQRKKKITIDDLFDDEGNWQDDEDRIENVVCNFYTRLFSSHGASNSEVWEVLQHVDLVIGQVGFWHIVGDDVYNFVSSILHGRLSPESINNTNIALIPKVKDPKTMSEFRLISLCNVLHKIVLEAIVLRLKSILPGIVTENQSAFVPGCLIMDNALVTLELFHTMKNRSKGRKGTIALKLDMSKAYDRVEWGFLRKLLLTMGLMNKVQIGELHGAKASRSGPVISHLLFANDSLFFARANRCECEAIVDILNKYEVASGRKINYEKSEVSFSSGVKAEQKSRQVWRLVHLESSLLGRVMKAKYYPNNSFLDSYLSVAGSFSWRSIWSSKALLKEGLIWRIGNGSKLNIWRDPWIADAEGKYVLSKEVEGLNTVSDLIDFDALVEKCTFASPYLRHSF
ncbi:uncharacterized protein LOC110720672 [Chenopodium quinoa]|uniref:uncharacterized protein LOC110720672 n=1 Tax=Chenopodium quinoa TaxID=63459 RepID=UPI000B7989DA|nr:uncharacterized protein LOC110720672 [Chenopodium quinoa]